MDKNVKITGLLLSINLSLYIAIMFVANIALRWIILLILIMRYVFAIFSAYFIYGVRTERGNSFVLPLSYILHLFLVLFIGMPLTRAGLLCLDAEMIGFDIAFLSFPFILLTTVFSFASERYKTIRKLQGTQLPQQTRNKMLAAAIMMSAAAIIMLTVIFFYSKN